MGELRRRWPGSVHRHRLGEHRLVESAAEVQQHADGFRMLEDESLAGLLAGYDEVAAATDELVLSVDLDSLQPLPKAPWFEPGASWSARRVFTHILAETAQHAGHADIVRETIDGQKSMG